MKNLVAIFTSFGVALSFGQSVTILTSDGDGADAFVQQGESSRNFGSGSSLFIKGGNGTVTRKVYLRFDLSAVNEPLVEASLTLTVATNNSGGPTPVPDQNFDVDLYGLINESLDNWVEGDGGSDNLPENEITYANAPANIIPGNDFNEEEVVFLGTLNVPGTPVGESLTFSSPELLDFLNSDTNGLVSILMRRQGGSSPSNLAFRSKEAASGTPQLDLSFGVAPTLEVSAVSYNAGEDKVTLTWRNTNAGSYAVSYSQDLIDWTGELAAGVTTAQDENPDDAETITVTFDLAELEREGKRFFRILEGGE